MPSTNTILKASTGKTPIPVVVTLPMLPYNIFTRSNQSTDLYYTTKSRHPSVVVAQAIIGCLPPAATAVFETSPTSWRLHLHLHPRKRDLSRSLWVSILATSSAAWWQECCSHGRLDSFPLHLSNKLTATAASIQLLFRSFLSFRTNPKWPDMKPRFAVVHSRSSPEVPNFSLRLTYDPSATTEL